MLAHPLIAVAPISTVANQDNFIAALQVVLLEVNYTDSHGLNIDSLRQSIDQNPRRSGAGFLGILLAGRFGSIVTASGFYLALKQNISGFSVADPHSQRQSKELQDRTTTLESAVRAGRPAPAGGYPAASQGPEGLIEIRSRLDGMVNAGRDLDRSVQELSEKIRALEQGKLP